MITRLRRPALVATLLVGGLLTLPASTAAAAPVEACAPAPKSDTSLCLTYNFTAFKPNTTTATQASQAPVDVTLSWENTSTNFAAEAAQPRWLSQVSANLLGSPETAPIIAPSSTLPDGLLIAGSATDCGTNQGNFAACTAGRGTGQAVVANNPLGCAVCDMTFGIQRIENERDNLGTKLVQLKVTLNTCVNKKPLGLPQWVCTTSDQVVSLGEVGTPLPFVLVAPTSSASTRTGIATAEVNLNATSGAYTVTRLPMRCGPASANAVAKAVNATSVTVVKGLEVFQCAQLTVGVPAAKVTYGGSTSVSGDLRFYDRGPGGLPVEGPIGDEPVQLRACAPTAVVPCSATPRTTITDGNGNFSFSLKPTKNTRYFIQYAGFDDGDIHVPASYVIRDVKVAPKVTLTSTKTSMVSGTTVKLYGAVGPRHAGSQVTIQRYVAGTWKAISKPTLDSTSKYAKALKVSGTKGTTAKFRVMLPAHADHLTGLSRTVSIRFS